MSEPSKPDTAELPDIREQLERQLAERLAECARHVANGVRYMASLPLDANVQFMTVMATKMPYIGRG